MDGRIAAAIVVRACIFHLLLKIYSKLLSKREGELQVRSRITLMNSSGKFIADFPVDQDAQPKKVIRKLLQHLDAKKGAAVCTTPPCSFLSIFG